MSPICPKCRGLNLRRRVRAGIRMALASLLGRWPYQCETCGNQFYLKKRYVHTRHQTQSAAKQTP